MKILVCGDTHCHWGELNTLIARINPDIILQCGDFGYWPNFPKLWGEDRIKNKDTKIYWCPGNHEDWWALNKLENNEVSPNVFYMSRGSIFTLPDGRNVLFMGGAKSIDKLYRTFGVTWFPEEELTANDVFKIPNVKIDIVISHTAPYKFDVKKISVYSDVEDFSRQVLDFILTEYKPSLWYFGHWHSHLKGYDYDCAWTCLNMSPYSYWWEELKIN